MKLYKYRSLKNMEFVLDIIINERLHCAPYSELNDPLEGIFFSLYYPSVTIEPFGSISKSGTNIKTVRSVKDLPFSVERSRICSLSAGLSDVRLWSYYADAHQGVAIEIDFSGKESDARRITYVRELEEHGLSFLGSPSAEAVLSSKTVHWEYEQEYRVIQDAEFYPIKGRITAIYTGINSSARQIELLNKVMRSGIPMIQTQMNPHTLQIEPKQ
jgi:hypothetical protein